MNLKKFISGISALTIAASAFAGLAVTASAAADSTGVAAVYNMDMDVTANAFTAPTSAGSNRVTNATQNGYGSNTTSVLKMAAAGNAYNGSPYNATLRYDSTAVDRVSFDASFGDNNQVTLSLINANSVTYGTSGTPRVYRNSSAATGSAITFGTVRTKVNNVTANRLAINQSDLLGDNNGQQYFDTWLHYDATMDYATQKVTLYVYPYSEFGDYTNVTPIINGTQYDFRDKTNVTSSNKVDAIELRSINNNETFYVDNVKWYGTTDLFTSTITVKDGSDPINGATVYLKDNLNKNAYILTTNASGQVTKDVPAGTYNVSVNAGSDYPVTDTTMVVADGADNSKVVNLESGYVATIQAPTGSSVLVQSVTTDGDNEVLTDINTITAENDAAEITLTNGSYRATVTKDGYFTKSQDFTVADGNINVPVSLTQLYTVTYSVDASKGSVSGATQVSVGQDAKPVSAPTITDSRTAIGGYVFLGWSETENGSTYVTPTDVTLTGNKTFYAVFSDQITRSVRYNATSDSYVNRYLDPNEIYADTEYIPLEPNSSYGGQLKNGFINLGSVDATNAVSATINLYVPSADYSSNGSRRYNVNVYSTKNSGWNAEALTSDWSNETGGANHQLTTISVDTPKNGTGFEPGYFTNTITENLSELSNLYLTQTGLIARVNISTVEGGHPAYVEVFYTDYAVTVDPEITNGTVTSNVPSAKAGETVTLTVDPDDGYELEAISGVDATKVNDTEYTFIMPSQAVTVSATFTAVSVPTSAAVTEVTYNKYDSTVTDAGDEDLTAAKILVTVTGSINALGLKYYDAEKAAWTEPQYAGAIQPVLTGGNIVLGAIVPGLVDLTTDSFEAVYTAAE